MRSAPPWLVRLFAPVVPTLRLAVPLASHYSRPVRYDTTKLERLLGPLERTPLPDAAAITLDWLTGQRTLGALP